MTERPQADRAQLRGRLIGFYNTANNGLRAFSGLTVGLLGA